ncbi:MAG: hypothetical protein QXE31_00210 [Candidatus Woesearchaeota archaeon]
MRYNPYWFNDQGLPTNNLLHIIWEIESNLKKFKDYSIFVVGSNARGDWRSNEDLIKIRDLIEKAKKGLLSEEEITYLSKFYNYGEIENYFLDSSHRYYLDPSKMNVSDLDLKILGINRRYWFNLANKLCFEKTPNNYWNGLVHVILSDILIKPYFDIRKGWFFEDF